MKILLISLFSLLLSFNANSGCIGSELVVIQSASSKNVTRAYAGLKWTMGKGNTPDVVVGVRNAKVKSSGKTHGTDVSLAVDIKQGIKADQVRVKYFDGKVRNQNEVAVGYDFTKGLFGGVSVKAPYVNVGLDLFSVKELDVQPWMILDTHKKYKKPDGATQTIEICRFNGDVVPCG
jgi:hypothetical protein